ncbi:MAG: 50S ribosomal protein L21 [Deltaproteobacteria bacterium]|nr:50S ribosomal protein L21 [Deltaproteobacteria bacterium]
MYAVVKTGGKQYTVAEGDQIKVEKLDGEVGSSVELAEVLAVGSGDNLNVGTPTLDAASVTAEVLAQGRGKKVIVFKKKRRKGYTKKQGHRQDFTSLVIKSIKA